MNTIKIKFGSVGLCIWLAIGILYHLITSDIPFSWADPWLYVTMAIWPVFVLTWIVVLFLVGIAIAIIHDRFFKNHVKKGKLEKIRKEREERRRVAAQTTPSDNA